MENYDLMEQHGSFVVKNGGTYWYKSEVEDEMKTLLNSTSNE